MKDQGKAKWLVVVTIPHEISTDTQYPFNVLALEIENDLNDK